MNILLIEASPKDGQYMSGYLKMRGHHCEWLRKLDEGQPTNGFLSGLDSGMLPRKVSLSEYNLALIEGQIFTSRLGVEIAVKLAKANVARIAMGGVEGIEKLKKVGVFSFVINKSTFYEQIDELLERVGELVFETTRQKSNRNLLARFTEVLQPRFKKFRRKAEK
jgi:hypothetical protein